jgi:outer membrane protein OmpA-like peptidoglycan-associated protein
MSLMINKKLFRRLATLVAMVLVAGCGSAPPPPELVDARAAYAKAQNGPAASVAPAQLHEAKNALDSAESSFSDQPDSEKTKDLSYFAQRKAQWADAQGSTAQAIAARDKANADASKYATQGLAAARGELAHTKQALASETEARKAAEKRARDAIDKLAMAGALSIKEEARGTVIVLPGSVLFASAKWDLLPAAQDKLNAVAEALKNQQDDSKIVVEGHTDSQGTPASNLELGMRRATTVKDYFLSRGLKSEHISSIGIGQARPIADNSSPEGRANNRRVEIIITPIERR